MIKIFLGFKILPNELSHIKSDNQIFSLRVAKTSPSIGNDQVSQLPLNTEIPPTKPLREQLRDSNEPIIGMLYKE